MTNKSRYAAVYVLFIAFIGFTSIGAAQDSRTKVKPCKNLKYISNVVVTDNEVACKDLVQYDTVIADLSALNISSIPLTLHSLVISPSNENNWGKENTEHDRISISYKKNNLKWQKSTLLIFPHEVGHKILSNYFVKKWPLLQELKEIDELNDGFSDWRKDQFLQKNLSELEMFSRMSDPYQEFFADLVQALYFENPHANDAAFIGFGRTPMACRTFDHELSADFYEPEAHCAFSAIRVKFWQQIVKPNLSNKKAMLTHVADVMFEEIRPQAKSRTSLPIDEAAERLFEKVKAKYNE